MKYYNLPSGNTVQNWDQFSTKNVRKYRLVKNLISLTF